MEIKNMSDGKYTITDGIVDAGTIAVASGSKHPITCFLILKYVLPASALASLFLLDPYFDTSAGLFTAIAVSHLLLVCIVGYFMFDHSSDAPIKLKRNKWWFELSDFERDTVYKHYNYMDHAKDFKSWDDVPAWDDLTHVQKPRYRDFYEEGVNNQP